MLLPIALFIGLIALIVSWLSRPAGGRAREILDERLAKGEIAKKECDEMKRTIRQ